MLFRILAWGIAGIVAATILHFLNGIVPNEYSIILPFVVFIPLFPIVDKIHAEKLETSLKIAAYTIPIFGMATFL